MKDGRQARGALAAAEGHEEPAGSGDPRIHPLSPPRRNARRAMTRRITGSPPMAMAWRASILRARATATGLVAGRISQARAGRCAGDHRLARRAGLVHRRGRHDRHFLGRLQRPAGRGAPAAGPEGGRSRYARPSTAMPTTCISWAAACSTTRSTGAAISSPRRLAARSRNRRQGPLAADVEAPHRQSRLLSRCCGWSISAAMPSGSMAPSARITARSRSRC